MSISCRCTCVILLRRVLWCSEECFRETLRLTVLFTPHPRLACSINATCICFAFLLMTDTRVNGKTTSSMVKEHSSSLTNHASRGCGTRYLLPTTPVPIYCMVTHHTQYGLSIRPSQDYSDLHWAVVTKLIVVRGATVIQET